MNGIILAAMLALNPGYNNVGTAGEVVAMNAATSNATATVTVSAVEKLTLYTNTTAQVVSYVDAWRVTLTNENASSRWELPDDAYPITYVQSGVTNTIEAGAAYTIEGGLSDYEMRFAGLSVYFDTSDPYPYLTFGSMGGMVSNVLFNGVAPVYLESPCLSYVVDPATITTNVVGEIDYSAFVDTNGVSIIIGEPVHFDMPITNTVVTGLAPSATYTATNALGTVSTTNHFGTATLSGAYLFGGGVFVDGASEADKVNVIVK